MTPWWRVDFGIPTVVGGGKIWNRDGCCQTRLDGFQIWVGSNATFNALGNTLCFNATTTEHDLPPYTHSFDCAATGRYLFVVLTSGQCLHMREVEIYPSGKWRA